MANGKQTTVTSLFTVQSSHKLLMFPTRHLRYAIVAVFFILTLRTFQSFPGMAALKEIWLLIMAVTLVIPYLFGRARSGWRFTHFEIYILTIISIIPLLSASSALREFGQPMIYGLLSQRNQLLGAGALLLLYAYRNKLISLKDIQSVLLLLAWGTLGFYLFMHIFVDPAGFADVGRGFVGGGHVKDFEFKFRTEFVIFGFFYYAFIGFRHKSRRYWLLSLPFMIYLVVIEGGRSMLLSIILSFVYFTFRWSSKHRLAVYVPKILSAGLLLLILLYASNADYVERLTGKFMDAITVVLFAEETGDVSANSRILQSAVAYPYIQKHWILGNGDISNQWHGGFESVLNERFFPADIGIIGVIFMYGLLGIFLFIMQFFFAFRFSQHISRFVESTHLLDATKGYLLYFALHSLVTGRFAHYSQISFMFIALLYCIVLETRKNSTNEAKSITVGNNA